jgi:hypothetical protein
MLRQPARFIRAEHRLPPVRVRPLTAADAPLLRRWTIAPEEYVRIAADDRAATEHHAVLVRRVHARAAAYDTPRWSFADAKAGFARMP